MCSDDKKSVPRSWGVIVFVGPKFNCDNSEADFVKEILLTPRLIYSVLGGIQYTGVYAGIFRLSVSKGYQIAWQLLVQCEWFQQQTQRTVWKHSFSSRRWVEVGFGRQPNFTIVFLSVLNWLIKCQNQRLQTEMNTVIPISSWSNLVWHILLWVIHLSVY